MAILRRNNRVILSGPVLIGFGDIFDRSFGSDRTPRPYPKVTPSSVGGVLLPFPCPHCGEAKSDAVDPKRRGNYRDKERGHSWCPACQGRYIVDTAGTPLIGELPAGATCAPARVERGGKVEVLEAPVEDGFNAIGAIC
jgi:hypothetical protein